MSRVLDASLIWDRPSLVLDEKLFGENGARAGVVLLAYEPNNSEPCGVIAAAGRWIKLLCVPPLKRRAGIATSLVNALAEHGHPGPYRVGDHPGNYLSPGIDVRYDEGRAFFLARGFAQVGEVENIRVPYAGNEKVSQARLAAATAAAREKGYACRRATRQESGPLLAWITSSFAGVWAFEAARALAGPRRALHVATHNNSYVAFAAADGNNQGLGWFGPAGTDPAHRGRGLGEALLLACLLDVEGLPDAGVIAWIGPKAFYAKSAGAVDDRRFYHFDQKVQT